MPRPSSVVPIARFLFLGYLKDKGFIIPGERDSNLLQAEGQSLLLEFLKAGKALCQDQRDTI